MINTAEIEKSPILCAKEAERCVLGGIIARTGKGQDAMISALSEDDFSIERHRKIYCAIRSLRAKEEPTDLITIDDEMHRLYPNAADAETEAIIKAMTDGIYYVNTEKYIAMIKQATLRRKLLTLADEINTSVFDPSEDMDALMDGIRQKLRGMAQTSGKWSSMIEVMTATYEDLEKRYKGEIKGIKSGVMDIDMATGGFFPGELAVIGARPAVGKSAFGLQIAEEAARNGSKVCFISCEMVDVQFGQRMITKGTKIDGMKLRNAQIDDDDWLQIASALPMFSYLPISFTFGTNTIEEIRTAIQAKIDTGECDLVVIDYLQLLKTKKRFEMEHERVEYISHLLKQMTTEFRIPIVALAQAKRQNNNGRARCPVLDDLRSSGAIEQDADTVIFLHRPDDESDPAIDDRDRPYFEDITDAGMQYIAFSVAKQRQGQTGIIGAAFDPAHMRYITMDEIRKGSERR